MSSITVRYGGRMTAGYREADYIYTPCPAAGCDGILGIMQEYRRVPQIDDLRFITPYNPAWPDRFAVLADALLPYLPPACVIHHVGSTAIPGMPAKDIIDMDIECPIGTMPAVIAALAERGYEHEGDLGIQSREAFRPRPGSEPATWPPHHLYACEADSPELARHLAYRTYLIAHPDRAAWLAAQKILADGQAESRDDYIERKAAAYTIIVREAVAVGSKCGEQNGCV